MKLLSMAALLLLLVKPLSATESKGTAGSSLWKRNNLVAWCIVPGDTMHRTPAQRAEMLARLGFKHYAYDWRDVNVPTFDAEVDEIAKHGIEFTAWWFPTDATDPHAQAVLDVIGRHHIHPQLWVMGDAEPKTPLDQAARVKQEADRIHKLVDLAHPYGCKVELYNYGGWSQNILNELAVVKALQAQGIRDVGLVYNFSHGEADVANFPAVWHKIKNHVVEVNLAGTVLNQKQQLDLGLGDHELKMMRTIQDSGWRGPVGVIVDRNADSEAVLKKDLEVVDSLRKKLAE